MTQAIVKQTSTTFYVRTFGHVVIFAPLKKWIRYFFFASSDVTWLLQPWEHAITYLCFCTVKKDGIAFLCRWKGSRRFKHLDTIVTLLLCFICRVYLPCLFIIILFSARKTWDCFPRSCGHLKITTPENSYSSICYFFHTFHHHSIQNFPFVHQEIFFLGCSWWRSLGVLQWRINKNSEGEMFYYFTLIVRPVIAVLWPRGGSAGRDFGGLLESCSRLYRQNFY